MKTFLPILLVDRLRMAPHSRFALVALLVSIAVVGFCKPDAEPNSVPLSQLVSPSDPLYQQDLTFDATFARMALQYVRSSNPEMLDELATLPAAEHILNHARHTDNDVVPRDSTLSLVKHLLRPSAELKSQVNEIERSIEFFSGPLLDNPQWVNDVLYYLPAGFRFHGRLYLTFGYDIGVAFGPNASLNGASGRFDGKPRELLYYAIHELHHVGFYKYQPPPRVGDIKTCADILRLVDHSTASEGMAVYAARPRRMAEHALSSDPDYVALENPEQMRLLEQLYYEQCRYLKSRGNQPADSDAFAVIERMSSGDRLWYRVGALMAGRIEDKLGHTALVALIAKPHPTLVETYNKIRSAPGVTPLPNP